MAKAAKKKEAPTLERRDTTENGGFRRSVYALPVQVDVVIGTARPTIAELLKLDKDSLLTLDKSVEDPIDLCVNNRVIARGQLVETDPDTGAIGFKISEIVDISDDLLV